MNPRAGGSVDGVKIPERNFRAHALCSAISELQERQSQKRDSDKTPHGAPSIYEKKARQFVLRSIA
jgi:hypothetical protein